MKDAPVVDVTVEIPRAPADVRAWWTEMAADYRAADPKEQPHRIVTLARDEREWRIDTYWRVPPFSNLRVPEVFTFRPDGWDVAIRAPMGVAQRDEFTLTARPDGGTTVRIRAWVWARDARGWVTAPLYAAYARKNFPRWWKAAGKICARDAPRVAQGS